METVTTRSEVDKLIDQNYAVNNNNNNNNEVGSAAAAASRSARDVNSSALKATDHIHKQELRNTVHTKECNNHGNEPKPMMNLNIPPAKVKKRLALVANFPHAVILSVSGTT